MVEEKKCVIMACYNPYDQWTPIMVVDTKEQAIAKVEELEHNQPEYCEKYAEEVSNLYDRVYCPDSGDVFAGSRDEEVRKGLEELEKKYTGKTDCQGEAVATYFYTQCEYEPK